MARFELFVSRRPAGSEEDATRSPGRLWRLKSLVVAILIASVAVGLLIAVLVLGALIAAVFLIVVVATLIVASVRIGFHRARMRR